MSMVRKQLYIEEGQDRALERRAKTLGISEAEVVRAAPDAALAADAASSTVPLLDEDDPLEVVLALAAEDVQRGHHLPRGGYSREELHAEREEEEAMMAVQDLEDYDEVVEKFLRLIPPEKVMRVFTPEQRMAGLTPEQRMAGLTPEQRMAGLTPEQRVAGLTPEQLLLRLPDEVLRALSEDFVAHLPEPTRTAVRKRLGT